MGYIRVEGDFKKKGKKKRYIVERTSKAEIRLEDQGKRVESCRENL